LAVIFAVQEISSIGDIDAASLCANHALAVESSGSTIDAKALESTNPTAMVVRQQLKKNKKKANGH
jgi:hypothetical protein